MSGKYVMKPAAWLATAALTLGAPYAIAQDIQNPNGQEEETGTVHISDVYTKSDDNSSDTHVVTSLYSGRWDLGFGIYLEDGGKPETNFVSRVKSSDEDTQWYVFARDDGAWETKLLQRFGDALIGLGAGDGVAHAAVEYNRARGDGWMAGYINRHDQGESENTFAGQYWREFGSWYLGAGASTEKDFRAVALKTRNGHDIQLFARADESGLFMQWRLLNSSDGHYYALDRPDAGYRLRDDRFTGGDGVLFQHSPFGYKIPNIAWRSNPEGRIALEASYHTGTDTAQFENVLFLHENVWGQLRPERGPH